MQLSSKCSSDAPVPNKHYTNCPTPTYSKIFFFFPNSIGSLQNSSTLCPILLTSFTMSIAINRRDDQKKLQKLMTLQAFSLIVCCFDGLPPNPGECVNAIQKARKMRVLFIFLLEFLSESIRLDS